MKGALTSSPLRRGLLALALTLLGGCASLTAPQRVASQEPVDDVVLRFMERAPAKEGANEEASDGALAAWIEIQDPERLARLRRMADNEPARLARSLYREVWAEADPPTSGAPTFFIGLEPGGNYARVGFELLSSSGERLALRDMPYLLLAEDEDSLSGTLLHEGGHVMHALLSRARPVGEPDDDEGRFVPIAPIPHSTAAVTDRFTAFSEGFAIHLETVQAHCGTGETTRAFYDRRAPKHGRAPGLSAEYYAAARDLTSYAQTFARYGHVRDGLYAFEAAPASDDYLRLQLDPARDRRRLRSGGALVASEGFIASTLFHVVTLDGCPGGEELRRRYRALFRALHRAETEASGLDDIPILELLQRLREVDPDLGTRAIHVFLDLSRGATMDPEAPSLWARLYDTALHLDVPALKATATEIEARRRSWERDALADVRALARNVGPVVVLKAPSVKVGVALFGELRPLTFDVNAVDSQVLALVPGMTAEGKERILTERQQRPFASADDFFARTSALGLPDGALVRASSSAPE